MLKFLLFCALIFLLPLFDLQISYGYESNASTMSFTVANEIYISDINGPDAISVSNVVPGDDSASSGSSVFDVIVNDDNVSYDIWLTVPPGNFDSNLNIYIATNENGSLPLDVTLTGTTSAVAVSVNPAGDDTNNSRPTGTAPSGNAVTGTNLSGTIYTATLTEDLDNYATYSNIPTGVYTLILTTHVALN